MSKSYKINRKIQEELEEDELR